MWKHFILLLKGMQMLEFMFAADSRRLSHRLLLYNELAQRTLFTASFNLKQHTCQKPKPTSVSFHLLLH